MRILIINSVCGIRSTGRICAELARKFTLEGHEVRIAYGRENVPNDARKCAIRIGNDVEVKINALKARLFDNEGRNAYQETISFLAWAEEFNPEFLWIHNLHGYYINYELLFDWIKSRNWMKVNWTLHDCWAVTGHCAHFGECDKWTKQCCDCPSIHRYPTAIRDGSKENYEKKKAAFTGVQNMTIITPSKWLRDIIKRSYLNTYPVEVRYNSIDLAVFQYRVNKIKAMLAIENKFMILGVASAWSESKGLNDFYKLQTILPEKAVIVLVGLTAKQLRKLPKNIIGVERTNSAEELAMYYSAADLFFNPTYSDTYPTVNLEAEACGTKVITYATGGCPETIRSKESCVIPVGAYEKVLEYIV